MRERFNWSLQKITVLPESRAVPGKCDGKVGRHVGVESKQLWETIVQKLPEMSGKAEELLKKQS